MKKQVIVTTSWDDGDPLDLRVGELLRSRGLPGTFYVPMIGHRGRRTLQPHEMRNMVRDGFEIGAHSHSHRSLDGMEPFELQREVRNCRSRLEDIIDNPVTMFCYPNGRYDGLTVEFVRRSGYVGARTARMLRTDAGDNRYEIPTTLQAYPHPPLTYVKNALKGHDVASLARHSTRLYGVQNWVEFGIATFDYVLEHGGVWHVYGHSWELEDFRLWDGLRILLNHVAHRDGVEYLSNGEMAARVYGGSSVPMGIAA